MLSKIGFLIHWGNYFLIVNETNGLHFLGGRGGGGRHNSLNLLKK